MKLFEIVEYSEKSGISFTMNDDRLGVTGPQERMHDLFLASVKTHKDALIRRLQSRAISLGSGLGQGAGQVLSYAQRRLFFLHTYDTSSTYLNIRVRILFRGSVDVTSLLGAINGALSSRPVYAQRYLYAEGELSITTGPFPSCGHLDLSDVHPGQQEEMLTALRLSVQDSPFDLSSDAPVRAVLIAIHNDVFELDVAIHHIVTDEWSIGLLLNDIRSAYEARCLGRSAVLVEERTSYSDFALWQKTLLTRADTNAA